MNRTTVANLINLANRIDAKGYHDEAEKLTVMAEEILESYQAGPDFGIYEDFHEQNHINLIESMIMDFKIIGELLDFKIHQEFDVITISREDLKTISMILEEMNSSIKDVLRKKH